ncbi:MAG: aspartate kinase [Nitrosopumilaceae archaeon]
MTNLIVSKFGGSAIGVDGLSVPIIIQRVNELKKNAKVITVFSAPLTIQNGKTRSLTDIVLDLGRKAESGENVNLDEVKQAYEKILELVSSDFQEECKNIINSFLENSKKALDEAKQKGEFVDEVRSKALAYSGELLMSQVMNYIMRGQGIKSGAVQLESWPIITDNNIESTNFLVSESLEKIQSLERLLDENDVVSIGGFIGKTADGVITTYERGGSDRTAANLGILFHKKFDTTIDFEKDSAVVSADPKIVGEGLSDVVQLSYNEARLAGMFGMKILDPIAIKEILEHGVDMPIIITNMKESSKITTIKRNPDAKNGHPLKIVTGKRNCAIFRIETKSAERLLDSLENDKRYSEYIILSPYTRDGVEFTRILFLDGDYVKRNEKYLLGFDSLATITYNRGVITLIGDEMWRVQQIASKASAKIGEAGLNILNMDAQEETSRIIIVVEDSEQNIEKAIKAIHSERSKIKFV